MLAAWMMGVASLVYAQAPVHEELSGEEFLNSLQGTYLELFSTETCLNPEFDPLWQSEARKFAGAQAEAATRQLIGGCQGTRTGEEAVAFFNANGGVQFCCAFLQGVKKFCFSGSRISGLSADGQTLFSHPYRFVGKDTEGNYVYETQDGNTDEFRYFWMRPDSPKETYHIEFRYGDDPQQLSQLMTGKYAYWMASGVREGHQEEWQNSIKLFVEENLGQKE